MTFEEQFMLSEKHHPLMIPYYCATFGIDIKKINKLINDRSGTADDLRRKIDLRITGSIYDGSVQEKLHTFDWIGYLTITLSVRDFDHSKAEFLSNGYVNEEENGLDAFMLLRMAELRAFLINHRDSPICSSGRNKGGVKVFHKWRKVGPRGDFLAIPLVYLLDQGCYDAIVHLSLSSLALQILGLQRKYYDLKTPKLENMLDTYG
jgi:hypothetical protein